MSQFEEALHLFDLRVLLVSSVVQYIYMHTRIHCAIFTDIYGLSLSRERERERERELY